jgi:hypothetical protein
MSYSIRASANTKLEALDTLMTKFDTEVVAHQPVHAADREAVLLNVRNALTFVAEPPEGQEVSITISGYLAWHIKPGAEITDQPKEFTACSINVGVGYVLKQ